MIAPRPLIWLDRHGAITGDPAIAPFIWRLCRDPRCWDLRQDLFRLGGALVDDGEIVISTPARNEWDPAEAERADALEVEFQAAEFDQTVGNFRDTPGRLASYIEFCAGPSGCCPGLIGALDILEAEGIDLRAMDQSVYPGDEDPDPAAYMTKRRESIDTILRFREARPDAWAAVIGRLEEMPAEDRPGFMDHVWDWRDYTGGEDPGSPSEAEALRHAWQKAEDHRRAIAMFAAAFTEAAEGTGMALVPMSADAKRALREREAGDGGAP